MRSTTVPVHDVHIGGQIVTPIDLRWYGLLRTEADPP